MKNAKIIAVLALLTLSLSGCANVDRSEVSAPSSQETVTAEPVQSTVPQESTTVSVSESTEIPAESTAEPETGERKPEVSTPEKEETPPTVSTPTETAPPKASVPLAAPTETQPQEPEPPAGEEPAEPAFDIQTWIDYAKAYAESVGLRLESSAVDCWDNPIDADADRIYLERDICSRLNRYAADETITDVWVWYEAVGANSYLIYIGYA